MTQVPIIRITSDGSWRTTDSTGGGFPATGSVRISGYDDVPEFDIDAVLEAYFPGIVVQRNLVDAITVWLIEHGTVTQDDVDEILALANIILAGQIKPPTLPTAQDNYFSPVPYPPGMQRWPQSNPTPGGWSIVDTEKVVHGGQS